MRVRSAALAVVLAPIVCAAGPAWAWEDYERGEDAPVVSVPAAPVNKGEGHLPIFGLGGDVGVPDGVVGSLVVRPFSWLRLQGGLGTNGISRCWRGGLTLLPFRAGPSLTAEYGRYGEGNANGLARKFVGDDFEGSPLLERVGYEFGNLHLGLDFGSRRFVFFIHGGYSFVRGQIRNVDTAIADSANAAGSADSGTTEVSVRQDPKVKATGTSVKLGLIIYIW